VDREGEGGTCYNIDTYVCWCRVMMMCVPVMQLQGNGYGRGRSGNSSSTGSAGGKASSGYGSKDAHEEKGEDRKSDNRYRDSNELRFSLR
jgi:hypothetical protein